MTALKKIERILMPLAIFSIIGMVVMAFTSNNSEKGIIVVVSPYSATIKESIDTYSKQGYYVDKLISQDVATSISKDYDKGMSRDIKGDIILVMSNR